MSHWRTTRRQSGDNLPPGLRIGANSTRAGTNQLRDDRASPVVQRGGRSLPESQPASLSSSRDSGFNHTRSRLTSHASNSVAAAGTPPAYRRNSGEPSSRLFISDADKEFAAYTLVFVALGFPSLFFGTVYLLFVA